MGRTNKKVEYIIGGRSKEMSISGYFSRGENKIILDEDHNLIENLPWSDIGYVVEDFKNEDFLLDCKSKLKNLICGFVHKRTDSVFDNLEQYHKYVDKASHFKIISDLYDKVSFTKLGIDKKIIEKRVSEILDCEVSTKNPHMSDNQHLNEDVFHIRIVRPLEGDNNPYHRDAWLDRLRHAVNIYIPLWGSDENSSLSLIPKSHKWKESDIERTREGDIVNGNEYTVPAVTWTKYGLESIRPNPSEGEFMIFSPYLIHGGSVNFNNNITRISLELRFWEKK